MRAEVKPDAGIERECAGALHRKGEQLKCSLSRMPFVPHAILKADQKLIIEMGRPIQTSGIPSEPGDVWHPARQFERRFHLKGMIYRQECESDNLKFL